MIIDQEGRGPYQFDPMTKLIPASEKGVAKVEHFQVSKREYEMSLLRATVTRGRVEPVPEGTYAKLVVNGTLMMSDTPMEQSTNRSFVLGARGKVLIAGLGLGMILVPLLRNPKVESILVLEKEADVIDLISPVYLPTHEAKLKIVHGDAFTHKVEADWKFDSIYLDIWPNILESNHAEIQRLKRKYRRCLDAEGKIQAWRETDVRRLARSRASFW